MLLLMLLLMLFDGDVAVNSNFVVVGDCNWFVAVCGVVGGGIFVGNSNLVVAIGGAVVDDVVDALVDAVVDAVVDALVDDAVVVDAVDVVVGGV